jgi:hypothetical protein
VEGKRKNLKEKPYFNKKLVVAQVNTNAKPQISPLTNNTHGEEKKCTQNFN